MDRCALFVDAGHLLAEGGAACLGTKERKDILCNYPALITDLEAFAHGHCGLPVLRTYWYDGAKGRVATPAHQSIAVLTRVKLRYLDRDRDPLPMLQDCARCRRVDSGSKKSPSPRCSRDNIEL
jgi:hypothetical protein